MAQLECVAIPQAALNSPCHSRRCCALQAGCGLLGACVQVLLPPVL